MLRKPHPLPACAGIYMLMAPDKRFYIGASVNIRHRIPGHTSGQGAGKGLASAIKQFGLKAFKVAVLETVPPDYNDWLQIWLSEKEMFWIEALNPSLNMVVFRDGKQINLKIEDFEEPLGGW